VIYDAHGRPVRALARGLERAGAYRMYWDGRDEHGHAVASGVYWAALTARNERRTRRIVVVR
jgi:flagellar hook assembly protein FlgD